ncbi:hypothetical protein P3T27_006514 [Kitasatospora sp. MAA19]|uniref:hypothetical protein n=1 Tax=Kitasatospora sp. MAA19 TaxID=3035090 RepID=UPI002473DA63|nr:hypothetical protein [Kitasatospora sp. MAA19]MDH6709765.1 hypothetical protein [Kitasatospora sp. MAA19]
MTIDQQLAAAEARLTELQHAFVAAAYDADERRRLVDQIHATRREITRLYDLQPTT